MRRSIHRPAIIAALAMSAVLIAGCQSAMSAATGSDSSSSNPTHLAPVEWPLRFKSHTFGVRCYDTLECKVLYAGFEHGGDKPTPSSASRGPDYLKGWTGIHGGIGNFPGPAKVTWRSKDGTSRAAEINIGEIFEDELVRHNVPREEVADQPGGGSMRPILPYCSKSMIVRSGSTWRPAYRSKERLRSQEPCATIVETIWFL